MIRRCWVVWWGWLLVARGDAGGQSGPGAISASAIQIEQVDAGDVLIPMEFRVAIYESLLDRVHNTSKFKKVFRSGDRQAEGVQDLVTLKTTIEGCPDGSQSNREVTTVTGATKVDGSATGL